VAGVLVVPRMLAVARVRAVAVVSGAGSTVSGVRVGHAVIVVPRRPVAYRARRSRRLRQLRVLGVARLRGSVGRRGRVSGVSLPGGRVSAVRLPPRIVVMRPRATLVLAVPVLPVLPV
jgi:hypothetical protein